MLGKLLGRLAYRGWRDGWRADRRWAKGKDERLWRRDAAAEIDPGGPECQHPEWQPCARCDRYRADWVVHPDLEVEA